MTIRVNDPHMDYLPTEKSVTLEVDGDKYRRLNIHPWSAGSDQRSRSEVYVALGEIDWKGHERHKKKGEAEYVNVIVPREDFIEAILAVFPEMVRK